MQAHEPLEIIQPDLRELRIWLHVSPFDAEERRITLLLRPKTIFAIVEQLRDEGDWTIPCHRTMVELNGHIIPMGRWTEIRPKSGGELHLVGRPCDPITAALTAFFVAVGDALVAAAAYVPGAAYIGAEAAAFAAPFGAGAATFIGGAATVVGAAAIVGGTSYLLGSATSLIEPQDSSLDGIGAGGPSPSLRGIGNAIRQNEPYPYPVGDIRFQPPQGSFPFLLVEGNETVAYYLFVLGPGVLDFETSDVLIGDVDVASGFPRATMVRRKGLPGDPGLSLFTNKILQTPLNHVFEPILHDADSVTGPFVQVLVEGSNNSKLGVDINVPNGCVRVSNSGRTADYAWAIGLQYREATGPGAWLFAVDAPNFGPVRGPDVINDKHEIRIVGHSSSPFVRGYTWDVTPGQYEVRMNRRESLDRAVLAGSGGSLAVSGTFIWISVKGYDFTAPIINTPEVATLEMKIPLDETFNGLQNNLTVRVRRRARIYSPGGGSDADGWTLTTTQTRNPSAIIRDILQGRGNTKRPVPDSLLNIPAFTAYYQYCESFNDGGSGPLRFDFAFDSRMGIEDACKQVASSCRARFGRDSQGRFTVVFDGPKTVPKALISAANSRNVKVEFSFPRKIHAVAVQYIDRESGFDPNAEMVVYADGFSALNATDIVTVRFDGVTEPNLIHAIGRYFLAVPRQRRRLIEAEQDSEHLLYEVGDLVSWSHTSLGVGLASGRIKSTSDARYRDSFDSSTPEYCQEPRLEDGGSVSYGDINGPIKEGRGTARFVTNSTSAGTLAELFPVAQNWNNLDATIWVQPPDLTSLSSSDGFRLRVYGPTINDWKEYRFGTSAGLAVGVMTQLTADLNGAASATNGSPNISSIIRVELWNNLVNPAAGKVWRYDDLALTRGDGSISEVVFDQEVVALTGKSYAITDSRIRVATIDVEILARTIRQLSEFGVSADRNITRVFLSSPIAGGSTEPQIGTYFVFGEAGIVTSRMIVREKINGPDYSCRVRLFDEAPAVHNAVALLPDVDPQTSFPVPIRSLGPAKPVIRQVIADERALILGADGTIRARIIFQIVPGVQVGRPAAKYWSIKYRRTAPSAGPATPLAAIEATNSEVIIDNIESGSTYEITARAVGGDANDRVSDALVLSVLAVGKSTPPPDVIGFRIEGTQLRWGLPSLPLDIAGFQIKKGDIGGNFDSASIISGPMLVTAPPFDLSKVLDKPGTGVLYIVALDTSGNRSINPATITGVLGGPVVVNQVDIIDEHALGFGIVDQTETVMRGFDGLIGEATVGATITIPETLDDPDFPVVFSSLAGTGGTNLDVERTAPLSGTQSLKVIDVSGDGANCVISYIAPVNRLKSKFSFLWRGEKAATWQVQVKFIDLNDASIFSRYDFTGLAGLSTQMLTVDLVNTPSATGGGGAVDQTSIGVLEFIISNGSVAALDSSLLDDLLWTGGALNGVEVETGSGDLVQIEIGQFYNEDVLSNFYNPDPDSDFYSGSFIPGVYEFFIVPDVDSTPSNLSLTIVEAGGVPFSIQYKIDNDVFYSGPDDGDMYDPNPTDDNAYMYGSAATQPWLDFPGGLSDVEHQEIRFRFLFAGTTKQARLSTLQIILDVPDEREIFNDLVIPSSGTFRIPITKKYRTIRNVLPTIQLDGNGGVQLIVADKDANSGPSVQVVNSAGTRVQGLVDLVIEGVKGK